MFLKTLPLDVIRLICSFGYPEHKTYMKEVCAEVRHQLSVLNHNMGLLQKEKLKMILPTGTQWFLKYEADKNVLHDFFQQCIRCCCCSKHCNNRPTNYLTDEVSVGENFSSGEPCHCKCRSISRDIKRALYENYYPDYPKHRRTRFNVDFVRLK